MYQQVDGELDYLKEAYHLKLEFYEDWNLNKDTQSETDSEFAKLSKKVGKVLYPGFNNFYLVKLISYKEKAKYVSMLDDNTVFSITLYPNMSSLENDKVYKNMSSLADTRIYTNLSSFANSKVYTNLSSLGDKVFPNMSSLESSKVFPNMSSLESSKVFPNMSSLIQ